MDWNTLGAIAAIVVAVAGLVGGVVAFLVKYALLPWLLTHVAIPVAETRKQVTENSHKNDTPTVLDRIDEVKTQGDRIERLAKDSHDEVGMLSKMFDRHVDWSEYQDEELKRVQDKVDEIWNHYREKKAHEHE